MSKSRFRNVFVTVGTTQFEELIDSLNTPNTATILRSLGCQRLSVQFGTGKLVNFSPHFDGIEINAYSTKPSIIEDIENADLVISHAGAGSIIETLNAGKPVVVVVNGLLMENHQTELAERMFSDGHVLCCVPKDLADTLATLTDAQLLRYERGNVLNFTHALNRLMGFE